MSQPNIADFPIVSGLRVTPLFAERNSSTQSCKRLMACGNTSSGDFPKNVLLLIAVHRSGSTWIMDSLRCHPCIYMEPTAIVNESLCLTGGRYPVGLADRPDALLPIVQNRIRKTGAKIPSFHIGSREIQFPRNIANCRFAIEKVHPEFFDFQCEVFL